MNKISYWFLIITLIIFGILFSVKDLSTEKENIPSTIISFSEGNVYIYDYSNTNRHLSVSFDSLLVIDTEFESICSFNIFKCLSKFPIKYDNLPDSARLNVCIKDFKDTTFYFPIPKVSIENSIVKFTNIKNFNIKVSIEKWGTVFDGKTKNCNDTTIDCMTFLHCLSNHLDLAYDIFQNNGICVNIEMGRWIENKYKTTLKEKSNKDSIYVDILSGKCNPIVPLPLEYNELQIREYLYDKGIKWNESMIKEIGKTYALLNRPISTYRLFTLKNEESPYCKFGEKLRYQIRTNLKADYYYLKFFDWEFPQTGKSGTINNFLLKDITELVKSEIINNFPNGNVSLNQPITAIQESSSEEIPTKKNPHLLILIGINKDWTYQYIPIGDISTYQFGPLVIENDFIKPFLTDISSVKTNNFTELNSSNELQKRNECEMIIPPLNMAIRKRESSYDEGQYAFQDYRNLLSSAL